MVGISRSRSMAVPGVAREAKHATSLEQNVATWGHWSPGSMEEALWSRGMSISVPPTTLLAIGLDLGQ